MPRATPYSADTSWGPLYGRLCASREPEGENDGTQVSDNGATTTIGEHPVQAALATTLWQRWLHRVRDLLN